MSYYDILGVQQTAPAEEIKRAYRKLASQHHPDKGGDKHRFQEIQKAYEVLSDPQKRAQYDNPMSQARGFNFNVNNGQFDFESIFDIFGARFQHPGRQQQKQRAMMSLWITLRDAAVGGQRTVSIGTHQGTQAVEIDIPPGINEGESIQYPGIGPGGMDLIVTFRIHQDPTWHRNGLTLHTEHTVSVWDLILGCETPVRDIVGNTLSLTVPAGTQPGTVLRLRGRGIATRQGQSGDLLVLIQAQIPKDIPDALLAQIQQIRNQ
jgi:DnaJ-class molecular chaperone